MAMTRQIQLGPCLMVGSISATAVFVESLPTPPQLMVARPPPSSHLHGGRGNDRGRLMTLATRVERIGAVNRQVLRRFFQVSTAR